MYKGRVQRLATFLQSDIPAAVRSLDNMLTHLEAYLQVQTAGQGVSLGEGAETISRAAASEKVGLERFRSRTPTAEQRRAAPFALVTADHAIHQPWKPGTMQEWQSTALAGLAIDRQLPDPESRIILLPEVGQSERVYLERLEPSSDQDSGWYVGSAEENAAAVDPEKLIAVRLGDLVAARNDLSDLLGLPTGTLIIMDAGGPAAIFDPLGLDLWALALIKAAEPAPAPARDGCNIKDKHGPAGKPRKSEPEYPGSDGCLVQHPDALERRKQPEV